MKGVLLHDTDESPVEWTDIGPPDEPGPEEVTIDIEHAGLNHLDLWVKQGLPGMEVDYPFIMGSDGAGTVRETGNNVDHFKVGDRVVIQPGIYCGDCEFCQAGEQSQCVNFGILGETEDGVQREQITVDQSRVYAIPGDLTTAEAGVLPVAYLTAYRMLFSRSNLSPGNTVLIHGAGAGVSVACLQLARVAGYEVIVTSQREEKLETAESLGASETIHSQSEDVVETIQSITDGRGVDLVVDHVGEATWQSSIQSVRKGGTIVTCGATSGPNPPSDLQRVFWKQINIHGSTMGTPNEFESLLTLIDQDELTPYVDRVFDIEEVAEAHNYMAEQQQMGKIALEL